MVGSSEEWRVLWFTSCLAECSHVKRHAKGGRRTVARLGFSCPHAVRVASRLTERDTLCPDGRRAGPRLRREGDDRTDPTGTAEPGRLGSVQLQATARQRRGVRWLREQTAEASKPQRSRCHSVEAPAEDDERRHKPQRLYRNTKIHEGALLIPSMCGGSSENSVVLGIGTT